MKSSLAHRFLHGNFALPSLMSPEADLHLGVPARQRELVALAKNQTSVARRTLEVLETRSEELKSVIRNEIDRQSSSLASTIQQGAAVVAAAVDELGQRLSAELVGVRWELHQIRRTEEQVLQVLKRPRSTEAKELIQQGVRNLVNDKIEQAEERLLRACDLDNTDYQVLMNLSAVEVRKNDAAKAIEYAKDALNLPADLDDEARAEALWWLGRLYYTTEDYTTAAQIAEQSLKVRPSPRRVLQHGCYLALASQGADGFSTVRKAIEADPTIFALAAVSEDLLRFPSQLESLLSSLLEPEMELSRQLNSELASALPDLQALPGVPSEQQARLAQIVHDLERHLKEPSYVSAVAIRPRAAALRGAPEAFRKLSEASLKLKARTNWRETKAKPVAFWKSRAGQVAWAEISLDELPGAGCGVAIFAGLCFVLFGIFGSILDSAFGIELSDETAVMGSLALTVVEMVVWIVCYGLHRSRERDLRRAEAEFAHATRAHLEAKSSHAAALRDVMECLSR